MHLAQWTLIFAGALLLWLPRLRIGALAALGAGYALAFADGQLDLTAVFLILALGLVAQGLAARRPLPRGLIDHVTLVILAACFFLHAIPGFHNPRVVEPVRLTADAVPFSMYLNLDKPLIGFALLLGWPYVELGAPVRRWLGVGILAGGGAIIACLAAGFALGFAAWAPKWPEWAWLWVANNLLLVTLAEEALFRGYLQEGLTRLLAGRRFGAWLAIAISAVLFGLAHFAGGWPTMLLAAIAGAGYGIAYRHGGLQAAVLAHFGLNLVHFGLFTYPMLAR